MYNYDLIGKEYANDNNKVLMHFSIEEIEKGVNDLNLRRAGDRNDLSIEHVVCAHPIIYHHLYALFAIIIKRGHVPDNFKHGIIIPVIKDNRKGLGDVDNYRPITILSVFSKLFEICLYNKINGCLNVSGLQLGFVKEGGCDKNLYTVSNVVNYFLKTSSDVFIVTLDASSAFDKVNIYGLMTKLIKRNVPFDVIRTLLSWYTNSQACVKLSGYYLEYISINSGVKQGGILSLLFYNIYVDELRTTLIKADLGCNIEGIYYGTVFYADDIVLLGA